jgi:hypothetical protein
VNTGQLTPQSVIRFYFDIPAGDYWTYTNRGVTGVQTYYQNDRPLLIGTDGYPVQSTASLYGQETLVCSDNEKATRVYLLVKCFSTSPCNYGFSITTSSQIPVISGTANYYIPTDTDKFFSLDVTQPYFQIRITILAGQLDSYSPVGIRHQDTNSNTCPSIYSDDLPVVTVSPTVLEITGHCVNDRRGRWFLGIASEYNSAANVTIEVTQSAPTPLCPSCCNERGHCEGNGTCVCDSAWTGNSCQSTNCVPKYESNLCRGINYQVPELCNCHDDFCTITTQLLDYVIQIYYQLVVYAVNPGLLRGVVSFDNPPCPAVRDFICGYFMPRCQTTGIIFPCLSDCLSAISQCEAQAGGRSCLSEGTEDLLGLARAQDFCALLNATILIDLTDPGVSCQPSATSSDSSASTIVLSATITGGSTVTSEGDASASPALFTSSLAVLPVLLSISLWL